MNRTCARGLGSRQIATNPRTAHVHASVATLPSESVTVVIVESAQQPLTDLARASSARGGLFSALESMPPDPSLN